MSDHQRLNWLRTALGSARSHASLLAHDANENTAVMREILEHIERAERALAELTRP